VILLGQQLVVVQSVHKNLSRSAALVQDT
jgi:hypothetical protein